MPTAVAAPKDPVDSLVDAPTDRRPSRLLVSLTVVPRPVCAGVGSRSRPAYSRSMASVRGPVTSAPPPRGGRLARVAVVAAMAVVTINLWTGAPLLALWTGSKVQGSGPPKMGAVLVVVLCLAVAVLVLTRLLTQLEARHDALTGHRPRARNHAAWLRSMSDEHEHQADTGPALTALDRTLIAGVVLAVAAFEVWFFFLAGSSIGH